MRAFYCTDRLILSRKCCWFTPGDRFGKTKTREPGQFRRVNLKNQKIHLAAAIREFKEETGFDLQGEFKALTPIQQKAGKIVYAWAIEGNIDVTNVKSNFFEIEWPPKSGKKQSFPEIDKALWLPLSRAREKINSSQAALLDQLLKMI